MSWGQPPHGREQVGRGERGGETGVGGGVTVGAWGELGLTSTVVFWS